MTFAPPPPTLVEICHPDGPVLRPDLLARSEALHRELRPQLPEDYLGTMTAVVASGARMLVARADDVVVGLAVYRLLHNTISGRFLYLDDLVTVQHQRSQGIGAALLLRCEAIASEHGRTCVILDSGVQRVAAHRFYFRYGYGIRAFNFAKDLPGPR